MPPRIITQEQFRDFLERGVGVVRAMYKDRPHDQLTPALIAMVDVMEADHLPGEGTYTADPVVMPDFNENRYDLMRVHGRKFGSEGKMVVMAILFTEAWMVIRPIKEYKPNTVVPRNAPDRKEICLVAGMSVDQHSELMRAYINRDKQGRVILGRFVRQKSDHDNLLQTFFTHYALAYALAKVKK